MARDRIERVLQVILHSQEAPGFTEDFAYYCGRIPSYYQNLDGEVEGKFYSVC
jgi:hypothetical protein